ncbi:MAG TPA: helix-turn-helix domain-containing protein [Caulobacteraceae bacterium]|nr:helix-turn-helix domain-containing protein [Caulobacteraceae bacterium]
MSIARVAFREWFGLRAAEAGILAALYQTSAGFLSAAQLARLAAVTPGSVSVHMVSLRQALDTEAIDSERRRGYRLTDEGRAECREALRQVGEELRRAS